MLALLTPIFIFPLLYFFPWNPIYPAIVAMAGGALATFLYRPDLLKKTQQRRGYRIRALNCQRREHDEADPSVETEIAARAAETSLRSGRLWRIIDLSREVRIASL